MPNEKVEKLASDFFKLMPTFRKIVKPLEKSAKTLTPMQYHILVFLYGMEPLSMSELAGKMNISRQQLTPLTDKLEESGYIKRVHDPEDRRSVKISVTPTGTAYLEQHRRETLELIIKRFQQLSPDEVEELHSAVQTFAKILNR